MQNNKWSNKSWWNENTPLKRIINSEYMKIFIKDIYLGCVHPLLE